MQEMTLETKKDIMNDFMAGTESIGILEWLESIGFYEAPASKAHHGNFPGALFDHSLQVTYELQNLTSKLGLTWKRSQSPAVIGMLHDICKCDDYYTVPFGDDPNTVGIEWNKDGLFPGHGEKSLIMLMNHIVLTDEEIMCIRYHMGAFTNEKEWAYYSRAVRRYPNVLYTHMADMIASQIKGV